MQSISVRATQALNLPWCDGHCGRPGKVRTLADDTQKVYCGDCWRRVRQPPKCYNCGRFCKWSSMGSSSNWTGDSTWWHCDSCGETTYEDY
jgi:hypothetical protein